MNASEAAAEDQEDSDSQGLRPIVSRLLDSFLMGPSRLQPPNQEAEAARTGAGDEAALAGAGDEATNAGDEGTNASDEAARAGAGDEAAHAGDALSEAETDGPPLDENLEEPTTSHRALEIHIRMREQVAESITITDLTTPPKKRKRVSNATNSVQMGTPVASSYDDDDQDDGMTCPICLDNWEMSGDHRLVSLKCGHLFGESCIRRWLNESQRQSAVKVCPQCKAKATNRDIRSLYAKRLRAIDRSEEHDMRRYLEVERRRNESLSTELATVKMAHSLTINKLNNMQIDYDRLREMVRASGGIGGRGFSFDDPDKASGLKSLAKHRLYMEKNVEITREPGCRVLLYSAMQSTVIASQKSTQRLFPGYGVRFIDAHSFKPLHFLQTSAQSIRDIANSDSQHLLTVASRDARLKTYDNRTRQCTGVYTANDKQLWACAFDRNERQHLLYAGEMRGGVSVFDVRFPDAILREFPSEENFSPVINIESIPAGKVFSGGGFLVCQLQVLKFYEYINDTAVPMRLNVDGPFLSMQYDMQLDTVLLSARSNSEFAASRFILGQLEKIDGLPVLNVKATIFGSTATPYITRPTQMGVVDNTLVVGYLQDNKQLMVYDVAREERIQTLPVNEIVYDLCPVITSSGSYVAALTENKCRVYKVNSSGGT